uniref:PSP proline-rich domain-containing protein n=1 Tax=Anopheles maculatus TaxID=74869 RepID=A0A182T433_9DIPT
MDDNSNSQPSNANEQEQEDANDSDVEFVETSVSVVCIDDDNVEMMNSQPNSTAPLVTIHFNNVEVYQKLQKALPVALQALFDEHLPNQPVKIDAGKDGCSLEVHETNSPEMVDDGSSLFVIDSTPMKNKKNDGPIPSYRKSVNKVYDGQTPPSASSSVSKRPKAKQTCWNCEGSHALKDCKQPRNYVRIRQQKELFQKKAERYHADLEQKYGHIRPGHLSLELRNALGLGPRDLPLHVYKMRVFGYPPGWLEDAKITHSGLQLFGSNGDAVQHSDESDGEVDNARRKYDVRKIIEYPGFNEPPPSAMFDDSKYFNVPPYSEELSRENMIRQLEGTLVGGYRRKKMKLTVEPEVESTIDATANTEIVDMDAMEGSPEPPPAAKAEELEDGELSSDTETNQTTTGAEDQSVILIETPVEVITLNDTPLVMPDPNPPSPSLADLQAKQTQLMEQLANSSVATEDSSFINDIMLAEKLAENQELVANSSIATEDCSFMNDVMLAEKLAAEANQSTDVESTSTSMPPPAAPPAVALLPPPPAPPRPPSPSNGSSPADTGPAERPPEPESFDLGEIAMNKVPYIDEPASMGLKRMSLGTPILSAFTPYSTLPSGEAFSKGVSDVIHFENLPNSTGKYQQMKSLLSEVRLKMIDHLRETEDGS